MANPFNVLNQRSPMSAYQGSMGNIQSLYRAIMGSNNPMQAFQRIASQNPNMQPILQALQGGANPQQLFASLCQQRGINPQEFMRQITGNNGFNFSELQSENRDILSAISTDTASTIAAVERVGSGLVNNIHDVAMGVAESRFEQQNCCCAIQRAVDGVNYNGALNTAAINATTTAQTQKILDALAADKADRQAARIAQLEQQIAMQGVVRYPTSMTYGAGPSPFCACGTGYGNI